MSDFKTYQQRLIEGLLALGYVQQERIAGRSITKKYTVFASPDGKPVVKSGCKYFFVGPSGALRAGDSVTNSRSWGDPTNQTVFYTSVLLAGPRIAAAKARRERIEREAAKFADCMQDAYAVFWPGGAVTFVPLFS